MYDRQSYGIEYFYIWGSNMLVGTGDTPMLAWQNAAEKINSKPNLNNYING
jgi:hypothetical protein